MWCYVVLCGALWCFVVLCGALWCFVVLCDSDSSLFVCMWRSMWGDYLFVVSSFVLMVLSGAV
jgi:hypothetical protein